MAILNIRNLPDEVHAQLRIRAAKAGRSMEAEARAILREVVMGETPSQISPSELQKWVETLYQGQKPANVVETLIEERRAEAARE
ncbi:MAG: Arc family DNA-binding protein [Ardenticatenaceae bacterium]|nr:Arc family DNA-binding protein [Ardenticatenaceae bacterium]